MRILVVSHTLPVPANSGGPIRVLNLARNLSRTDEVDLISVTQGPITEEDSEELQRSFAHTHLVPWQRLPKAREACRVLYMLARGIPYYTKYVHFPGLAKTLRRITEKNRYDIIVIEHSDEARYLEALHPNHGARTFLSMHNVATVQYRRMCGSSKDLVERFRFLLTWLAMRSWEPRMAARFDHVITVSAQDRTALLRMRPDLDVAVIPNGVDTRTLTPPPDEGRRKNILLVGTLGYAPNVDAAFLLHDKVFPLVRAQVPDCTLTIVGREAPRSLMNLHAPPAVQIHSDVDDVRRYYADAMVTVVPLRAGGGTRLKILEALALGTPVVSTRIGCEGIAVEDGEHLLMADDAQSLATSAVAVLNDSELWNRLSANGRTFVEQQHDWASVAEELREAFCRAGKSEPGAGSAGPGPSA